MFQNFLKIVYIKSILTLVRLYMLNLISKYHPKFMIALGSKISGWANTHSSYATITLPETVEEGISIVHQAKQSGKKVLGRGAGRSYGDQSLNDGQILVDMKK